MTRETKKLFKVKRKITPLTVLVPLLLVGFVLMLFLKEHPLAKSINHTGHPSDDSL